jgi:hypothetical protein
MSGYARPLPLPDRGRRELDEIEECFASRWVRMGPRAIDFVPAFGSHSALHLRFSSTVFVRGEPPPHVPEISLPTRSKKGNDEIDGLMDFISDVAETCTVHCLVQEEG